MLIRHNAEGDGTSVVRGRACAALSIAFFGADWTESGADTNGTHTNGPDSL